MKPIRLDVCVDPTHSLRMTHSLMANYESDGLGR